MFVQGIHLPVKVGTPGKEIGNGVGNARDVVEREVVVGQSLHPASLSAGDAMGFAKVREVVVIRKDTERMTGPQKMMSPMANGFDYGQQFAVVDVVIQLRWLKRARVICNRMFEVVILFLRQSSAHSKGRCVRLECERPIIVNSPQHGV